MYPQKCITNQHQMAQWQKSEAYATVCGFIETVNSLVINKSNSQATEVSQGILSINNMLKYLYEKIKDFPPDQNPQRFGNKKFTAYYNWVKENMNNIMNQFIKSVNPELEPNVLEEVSVYLLESLGHPQRIDYGSGHELSFIAFLICLHSVGFLNPNLNNKTDTKNCGLVVFPEYLKLVRQLQQTYNFEPAGSRGVHALDDFQFVPFIWGSAQLIGREDVLPEFITNKEFAESMKNENLLFSSIDFIFKTKTGPFAEHSNTLYSISGVYGWQKVNEGMLKMYKGEVLNKFPVIQHFLFGSYFKMERAELLVKSCSISQRCCN